MTKEDYEITQDVRISTNILIPGKDSDGREAFDTNKYNQYFQYLGVLQFVPKKPELIEKGIKQILCESPIYKLRDLNEVTYKEFLEQLKYQTNKHFSIP